MFLFEFRQLAASRLNGVAQILAEKLMSQWPLPRLPLQAWWLNPASWEPVLW